MVADRQVIKWGILTKIVTAFALMVGGGVIAAEMMEVEILTYILKVVTMALIILVALVGYDSPSRVYKWAIMIGLVFSLAGDVFLMLPNDLFLYGLGAFAVAHLFYTSAFINVGGFYGSWRSAAIFALFGVFMAVVLWQGLQEDGVLIPALVYLVIIMVMAWQGYGQWRQTGERRAMLAFVGALLFVASDSLLAVNRFVFDLEKLAPLLVLGTYYPAQWLIGQSTGRKHR